jgi:type IV secretory pathway VirB10-like protein
LRGDEFERLILDDAAEPELPGLVTTKLDRDDPRLAVPAPELNRWRRSYVIAAASAVATALAAGVVFAASQSHGRVRRDKERLELYSQTTGGVPDAISRLATAAPPSSPGSVRDEEPGFRSAGASTGPEAPDAEDDDDLDSADEVPIRSHGEVGPQTNTSSTAQNAETSDELPPMAMPQANKGRQRGASVADADDAPASPLMTRGALLNAMNASQPSTAVAAMAMAARDARAVDDDDRKEQFIANGGALPDLDARLRGRALCELDAGTVIHAYLETAINTDLPAQGTLKATVTQNVLCGPRHEYVAIPQGTTLSGSADSRVAYGQSRVLFCWHRLYLPPSQRHPLGAKKDTRCVPGAEPTGEIGLEGEVDNHWDSLIGGIALSTFMSLGTSASAGSQVGYAPNIGQQLARGAASNIASAGDRIAQRELLRKPTVHQASTSFVLVLNADLPLEPFEPL